MSAGQPVIDNNVMMRQIGDRDENINDFHQDSFHGDKTHDNQNDFVPGCSNRKIIICATTSSTQWGNLSL